MSDSPSLAERQRFHGRRTGRKLRPGRRRLLQAELPRLRVTAAEMGGDPKALFAAPVEAVWLEVGFGGGEHLLEQARANPHVGLIGAEPFINGVAKLLSDLEALPQAERESVKARLRLLDDDVRPLIDALPAGSLARVFVLFPDPWPKRRHAHRRFINTASLDALARIMAPGAELRLASDDPVMVTWMLWHAFYHPEFAWLAERAADWRRRPADWPPTRYEQKALAEGRPATYLRFRRR